ncbi:hypothetical protein KDA_42740 [Dictyobacter alpinus]|uniref:Uncharacterized protein n=1 Tax=Dictyobacter alpinus TaxID=2014873 RepID=A0A402BBW3_9CHLR|nr:hypothetical protein [Dictyobacter alpinus]GCE28790.1 hypothetical protein KDA_42740 [Dictyobacter alpinus]
MYRLDLETLLLVLRGRHGILETTITSAPRLKGPCRVIVTVGNGQVTSCLIYDQQDNKLVGEMALKAVLGKVLEWNYRDPPPSAPPAPWSPSTGNDPYGERPPSGGLPNMPPSERPPSGGLPNMPPQYSPRRLPNSDYGMSPRSFQGETPAFNLSLIPRRMAQPSSQDMQHWSRQERSIFSLINGTHSIAAIAGLLHMDALVTLKIIANMASQGLVVF